MDRNKIYKLVAKGEGCKEVEIEVHSLDELEKEAEVYRMCGYSVTVESRERQAGE